MRFKASSDRELKHTVYAMKFFIIIQFIRHNVGIVLVTSNFYDFRFRLPFGESIL